VYVLPSHKVLVIFIIERIERANEGNDVFTPFQLKQAKIFGTSSSVWLFSSTCCMSQLILVNF
jgi:hypothetical protein